MFSGVEETPDSDNLKKLSTNEVIELRMRRSKSEDDKNNFVSESSILQTEKTKSDFLI